MSRCLVSSCLRIGFRQNSPIYVSRIIPGGVADRHGGLKRGDQLIAVNGVNVERECHETAVRLLKVVYFQLASSVIICQFAEQGATREAMRVV